jgi:predicted histone-like DNA-binding protein
LAGYTSHYNDRYVSFKQDVRLNNASRKRGLFPRIIRKKTVGLVELCERTASGTTFNAFELEIAAKMLVKGILDELSEGNNVSIEDFGTFSISAEATREAQQQHDIHAESICLAHRIQNIESAVETASSHVPAAAERMKRHTEFRVIQDRNYRSDFEKLLESKENKHTIKKFACRYNKARTKTANSTKSIIRKKIKT